MALSQTEPRPWTGAVPTFLAGGLFAAREVAELTFAPVPTSATRIGDWVEAHYLSLAISNELLGVAAVLLVPTVLALARRSSLDRAPAAAVGTALLGSLVPLLLGLVVVQGRLVYPVFGMLADDPFSARLCLTGFYGGLHIAWLVIAVAVASLGTALSRDPRARPLAWLGGVVAVASVLGSFPDRIGPVATFACRGAFAGWLVGLGWLLRKGPPPGASLERPPSRRR